jgi:hypothetical protein
VLIFCTIPGRNAPKESGVHFRITLNSQSKSICILFKIDRQQDPLIRDKQFKRPDYMSLYIDSNSCICTIIEMKGTNHNSLENGIEQILTLKRILETEIKDHLPDKLKVRFQGILLSPYNSQIPTKEITKIASTGFIILPIQYKYKAELYPYISRVNKLTDRYDHRKIVESQTSSVEELLTTRALPRRIQDEFYTSNFSNITVREGIYIEYLRLKNVDCITLSLNKSLTQIYIREDELEREEIKEIKEELELLQLVERLSIKFVYRCESSVVG